MGQPDWEELVAYFPQLAPFKTGAVKAGRVGVQLPTVTGLWLLAIWDSASLAEIPVELRPVVCYHLLCFYHQATSESTLTERDFAGMMLENDPEGDWQDDE